MVNKFDEPIQNEPDSSDYILIDPNGSVARLTAHSLKDAKNRRDFSKPGARIFRIQLGPDPSMHFCRE